MDLLIGTRNKGKFIEISEALAGLALNVIDPASAGVEGDPEETGKDFRDNALLKARFYNRASDLPTIADDSGIVVDALEKELGVHTRRWGAGPAATDEEWISFFLDRMKKEENRNARFICTIAFLDENGKEHLFEGACDGIITKDLEADYLPGLPISACFKPHGFDQVYSAMTIDQKNAISHRGRAVKALRRYLEN